jgi:N-acetylglucosaminyl-diphospho-decaprenol L-rhamnosyltransferase
MNAAASVSPRVSALIVSYNTSELLLQAIESVIDAPETEVIVLDNASHDGSPDAVGKRFPSVKLVRSTVNLGFAAGVNSAAREARAPSLLVLNPDARLEPGALHRLLATLETYPRAALVAPALRFPDGRPQASAFAFPGLIQVYLDLFPIPRLMDSRLNGRLHTKSHQPVQVDHPLGACMLIRGEAWHDVGPLDEGYFMYVEEVDWCRRARARGWQIWHESRAVAVHHAGAATRQQPYAMFEQLWRSRLRYYARFHGPTYNRLVHLLLRIGLPRARKALIKAQ